MLWTATYTISCRGGRNDRPPRKWFSSNRSRHPLGNGIPGHHNWSGTDENTARNEPLGSTPEWVKWSISIVRTPHGWVGRYDTYGAKGATVHIEVTPNFAPGADQELAAIYADKGQQVWAAPQYVGMERSESIGAEWDDLKYLSPEEQEEFDGDLFLDDERFNERWYQDADGCYHRIQPRYQQLELEDAADRRPFWKELFAQIWPPR